MSEREYFVRGWAYRVGSIYDFAADNETWYEYRVELRDRETGEEVDSWDSLLECYNGRQKCTHDGAVEAIQEITEDVRNGEADYWFQRA